MIEKPASNEVREDMLRNGAQNPIAILERNLHKGCFPAIDYLLKLRKEIKQSSLVVESPDADFSVFYKWGNDKLEYWIAMVKLLERAGHKQIDIQSAFMDLIVKTGPIDKSIPKNEVQKEVLALMNQAVEKVFGIKD
ncbi:hypothetical protein COZ82_03895 [Candidatus Kaiserbacteria bacterium CG_4_8_14_3_um_filter_38_9]|uniref:Uncharacterized protein n=1 Tax=Candidatus Kaiserbacteria bacterium CG_4_8_14_3_um_filter_38_9 TaxID=1974599 RepID=A0A2M7IMW4_9BACT|nr:MAG: hypothetical protein COZ82_03895 [Candidatus Kaiserbacteria bacterium CG_4_8_14_3_um_filter_38_9]